MDQQEYSRVLHILKSNLNTNQDIRKQAEEQLLNLTKQPRFSSYLLQVYGDQIVDVSSKLLAITIFKNIVTAEWKKGSLITEEEKTVYRDKLLLLLNNPNELSSPGFEVLAVTIGKISRIDYPSKWPNLMNILLELFEKSSSDNIRIVSLRVIKFVIKEFASKRWFGDREYFTKFSKSSFEYFINVWKDGTKRLLELLISNQDLAAHNSLLLLLNSITKNLRRVIEYGYTDYQSSDEICKYYFDIYSTVPELMKYRLAINNQKSLELVDKFIYLNQKVILKSQHTHPLTFIKLLQPSLQLFMNQILLFNPHDTSKRQWNSSKEFKSIIAQSINFIREVVNCTSYQSSYDDPDQDEIQSISQLSNSNNSGNKELTPIQLAQNYIKEFFNYERLNKILEALVSNCLIINEEEMERWESEPDEYIQELQVEDVYFELKPASYNLFILLMRHFHQDCVKIVIAMLGFVTSEKYDCNKVQLNTEQICLKEACYMTIGLGYYDLIELVDFENIFLKVFVPELQSSDPRFKIIKRRILWLICYWIGKVPEALKSDLVRLLLGFLKDSDMVVALTAMDAVKSFVDDLEFDYISYQPFLQDTLQLIISLFKRTDNATTKSNLLAALGIIFIKFNENIKPFTQIIYQLFESLWNNGEEEPMVKSAVLRSFSFFLQALNSDPSVFFPLLLPIINFSVSDKESVVYLREDGLELWFQTMVRVPSLTPSLLELFSNWPLIMSETLEFGEQCFKILDTYLLLGQIEFLRICGDRIAYIINSVLDESYHDWYDRAIKSIDRVLQIVPTVDAIVMLKQCLDKIIKMIVCGNEDDNSIVIVDYLAVFSRILTMNPNCFFTVLDGVSIQDLQQSKEDGDDSLNSSRPIPTTRKELYSTFMDIYFEMIDRTGSTEQRKLIGIGLSNLLTVPREEVLELIGTIISMVVGVRGDLVDVIQDQYCNDGTVLSQETSGVQIQSDKLFNNDPINTVNLSTYLYQKIQESRNIFGAQNFDNSIKSVHQSVLELAKPPST